MKKLLSLILALALSLSLLSTGALAKTNPAGQTVGTVLFYVRSASGEDVLVSHTTVAELEADMQAGKIDTTNHNYSLLDRYVTTVHQEAQGFTVPEYVAYAQSKSSVASLRALPLAFAGEDKVAFWEIDQTGFDELDTYTYNDLYGVARYNFPLLYEYWDYRMQDYCDPAGKMTRDEVVDHILQNAEPETMLLSVRAYSQRYMVTDEKYGSGDYNMENLWQTSGLMDNERTIRVMKPMTEDELRSKLPTASDTRYWVANIRLDMAKRPDIESQGAVAAPTAEMTEDAENYYITFDCLTPGATILYNHNYISPSYTPSSAYTGGTVAVPKSWFPDGTVTMTCRAVKDGYTDAGVVTLKLTASGQHIAWQNPYADVQESAWYYDYVQFVTEKNLFDAQDGGFGPNLPMTRAMLAEALYRLAGEPHNGGVLTTPFADVPVSAACADAVAWCYENGVVNGKSETGFDPDGGITRQEIAVMFFRYAKARGADITPADGLTAYSDAAQLPTWAREGMAWAVGAGLITGTAADTLSPQGAATRAQTAALVQRMADYAG